MAEHCIIVPASARWAPLIVPPRLSGPVLDRLLPALVGLNEDWLRQTPRAPDLYRSGVRYQAEPMGQEQWLTIPFVLRQGFGDCEDLACWRTAELRVRYNERAVAVWSGRRTPRGLLYHIRVRRGNGAIEDPSFLLGMTLTRKT